MTTIARHLAERIAGTGYGDLSGAAVHWARIAILDTVGCILAGAHEDCTRIADKITTAGGSSGDSLIFGSTRRVRPMDAAFVNGTASHALDYDDCSDTLGGHPSAPILPGLFALAETRQTSGRDFLAAYVAGWEAETRIARGVNFLHYEKGWHPTATLGVFGASPCRSDGNAACAHLLGLPAERIATALALAASFSSGIKANFGTMTKPLHVGHASRNGLQAALLAADGFTASDDVFEHKQGFLNVFNGSGHYNVDAMLAEREEPWDIVSPGVAIKQYPCCGSTHPAIDAILMLVREHGLRPEQIERVDSWTHARRLAHTNRPDPQSALDAKFSVQYCLARGIVSGRILIEHFEGKSYQEAPVQALLKRIHVAPQPSMPVDPSEHFGADVTVTLTDGRVLSQSVKRPLGRGPTHPLPQELLEAKFMNCAMRAIPEDAATRALVLLRGLEGANSIRSITGTLVSRQTVAAV